MTAQRGRAKARAAGRRCTPNPAVLAGGESLSECRRVATIGCALMSLLICPPARADASTVGTGPDELIGAAIAISSAPGETNQVSVSYDYDAAIFTITDAAGATAQPGCQQVDATTVTCAAGTSDATLVNRVVADLGDGDDSFIIGETGALYGASVDGGPGSDTIEGANRPDVLVGGDGDDILRGGGGADWLLGYDGDDTLSGGAGDDEIDGGDGSDAVDAGPGEDLVNLREDTDGRDGTADAAAICGPDQDRIAVRQRGRRTRGRL